MAINLESGVLEDRCHNWANTLQVSIVNQNAPLVVVWLIPNVMGLCTIGNFTNKKKNRMSMPFRI